MEANPSTKACTSVDGLAAVLKQFTVEIAYPESDVEQPMLTVPRNRSLLTPATELPFVLLPALVGGEEHLCRPIAPSDQDRTLREVGRLAVVDALAYREGGGRRGPEQSAPLRLSRR